MSLDREVAMSMLDENEASLRKLIEMIGATAMLVRYAHPSSGKYLLELIDHVRAEGDRITEALRDRKRWSGEVPNEEPIIGGAFDVNSHREGSRLQPGQMVSVKADVEPGENGTDGC
jgi:hypothetical protein